MISDKLRAAWRQYQLESTTSPLTPNQVMAIIEQYETTAFNSTRMLLNIGMGLLLIICCQGG